MQCIHMCITICIYVHSLEKQSRTSVTLSLRKEPRLVIISDVPWLTLQVVQTPVCLYLLMPFHGSPQSLEGRSLLFSLIFQNFQHLYYCSHSRAVLSFGILLQWALWKQSFWKLVFFQGSPFFYIKAHPFKAKWNFIGSQFQSCKWTAVSMDFHSYDIKIDLC